MMCIGMSEVEGCPIREHSTCFDFGLIGKHQACAQHDGGQTHHLALYVTLSAANSRGFYWMSEVEGCYGNQCG